TRLFGSSRVGRIGGATSPDGQLLALRLGRETWLRSAATLVLKATLRDQVDDVWPAWLSHPTARLTSGERGNSVRSWDVLANPPDAWYGLSGREPLLYAAAPAGGPAQPALLGSIRAGFTRETTIMSAPSEIR